MLKRFFKDEEGQGMVEYGLIIALVAVVLIASLSLMNKGLSGTFESITDSLGGGA